MTAANKKQQARDRQEAIIARLLSAAEHRHFKQMKRAPKHAPWMMRE